MLRRLWALFKGLFSGSEEGIPLYGKIALPLVIVGIGIVAPGPKDAILSYLNSHFSLGLSLDAPLWAGGLMIAAGLIVFMVGFFGTPKSTGSGDRFVAIRHQSFQPLTGLLPIDALPKRFQKRRIDSLLCDQSNFLSGGVVDPVGAVRQQQRLTSDVAAIRKSDPNAAFGYYGIVHIPLQFLAGCGVAAYPEVLLFELNRTTSQWQELQRGQGPDLKIASARTIDPPRPSSVVIRIEVSYPVQHAEVQRIIAPPFREYVLGLAVPAIDRVTHYDQVEALSAQLRKIMDEIHNELSASTMVHIFYAGPVSVGFSLGRRISRTIHPKTYVYNYTSQSNPSYSWGVEVTGEGKAEDMVVRPVALN